MLKWTLVLMALIFAQPARAQFLDPDAAWTCWACFSHDDHFAVGATLDLAVRAPFIATRWRHSPIGRVALVGIIGTGYELLDYGGCLQRGDCGQPDTGFGLVDLTYDVAGAISMELITATLRWLWRHR